MTSTQNEIFHELQRRGFIHQCTDEQGLRAHLARPRAAYLGFDATADSLHVGHMQGLMLMRWLQKAGHTPVLLVGGATTRVGDPSFRDASRPMLDNKQIAANIAGISSVFDKFVSFDAGAGQAQVVDNSEWLDGLGYLEFLSRVGRFFTVNRLLGFDAIKNRLEHSLSVQEFGYTLLQAFDFTELARRKGCTLQVGGADQWANIINGIELSHKEGGPQLFGLTMPLLTTADGRKMGKSAGGAVWLNADKLTPFDFWQFWRNTDDRDVERFLALFTEIPMDEVERLGALRGVELNEAKTILATHVTALVHGQQAADAAQEAARAAASGAADLEGLVEVPVTAGMLLVEVLVKAGLAESNGAARRLADGGGLRLNGEKVDKTACVPTSGENWLLSSGRKRHVRLQLAA